MPDAEDRQTVIEDRIKAWREDDEIGMGGVVELICEAEEALRHLRGALAVYADPDNWDYPECGGNSHNVWRCDDDPGVPHKFDGSLVFHGWDLAARALAETVDR